MKKISILMRRYRKFLGQITRFGIVGVIAVCIHYGIYYLLSSWINLNVAYTIGYGISFLCNFYLSNHFTFRTQPSLTKGVGFGVSHLINYSLHMVLFNLYLYLGVAPKVVPLLIYPIAIPVNFTIVRFVLTSKRFNKIRWRQLWSQE